MTQSTLAAFTCTTRSSCFQMHASGIFQFDTKRAPSFHLPDLKQGPKACRLAERTTEFTVMRDSGHISRADSRLDSEHASDVRTLDPYARSRPSFKFPNARTKEGSVFSRSNIVQGEPRASSRMTRSTLAVFTCSTRS